MKYKIPIWWEETDGELLTVEAKDREEAMGKAFSELGKKMEKDNCWEPLQVDDGLYDVFIWWETLNIKWFHIPGVNFEEAYERALKKARHRALSGVLPDPSFSLGEYGVGIPEQEAV